jgi:hypothetical protein
MTIQELEHIEMCAQRGLPVKPCEVVGARYTTMPGLRNAISTQLTTKP